MRKGVLIFLFVMVLLASVGSVSAATTYYVDGTNGNDGNTGLSIAQAWKTIEHANLNHVGGDTVYILPGEYREGILPKAGSPGAYTVYSGYGPREGAKIIGSDEINPASWNLQSPNVYWTSFSVPNLKGGGCGYKSECFENRQEWYRYASSIAEVNEAGKMFYDHAAGRVYLWTFDGSNPSTKQIECNTRQVAGLSQWSLPKPSEYPSYLTIQNLTFMQSYSYGIQLDGSTSNVNILNNEFMFNSGPGSCAANPSAIIRDKGSGGQNYVIKGNLIHDQGSDKGPGVENPAGHGGTGIKLYDTTHSLVEDNIIYNVDEGINPKSGYTENITIRGNTIFNFSGEAGINFLCNAYNHIIEGNLIYDSLDVSPEENYGIGWWGDAGCGLTNNISIVHNTFYNLADYGILMDAYGVSSGHFIKNNIFAEVTKEIGTRQSAPPNNLITDNNTFYKSSGSPTFVFPGWTVNSLSQWQTFTGGQEQSPLLLTGSDPLFVDEANLNFNLDPASLAIDAGEFIQGYHCSVNYETDPNQQNCKVWYGSAPDMGAYEFISTTQDCSEGAISSQCTCGSLDYSLGFCCNVANDPVWFDPDYPGCPLNYFYVDQNNLSGFCSDANVGSETQPWCTMGKAAATLVAGDVALVKQGVYTEPGTGQRFIPAMNPANSGTFANPITFKSYSGHEVNLTNNGLGPLIGAARKDYIVWDGFNVIEGDSYASDTGPVVFAGESVFANCSGSYVVGNVFKNSLIEGTNILSPGDNHNGIRTECAIDITIKNNIIRNGGGDFQNQVGIMMYATYDSVFENNEIYNYFGGIFPKGGNERIILRYNLIHDVKVGIRTSYTNVADIYQNIVYDVETYNSGWSELIHLAEESKNISYYNNVFYNSTTGVLTKDLGNFGRENVSWHNNIFLNIPNPIYTEATLLPDLTFNYNNYYGYSGFFIDYSNIGNLLAWQNNTGNDLNSTDVDPGFVDVTNRDFHLNSTSLVRNKGLDIYDLDNDGDTTDSINIGAYVTGDEIIGIIDYGILSVQQPPVVGSADVNNDGVVNVIDLSLTTYWQGKNNNDSDWGGFTHLDINNDGKISFSDVLEVMLKI